MYRVWLSCRFHHFFISEVCLIRRSFFKCGVRAVAVVECEPFINHPFGHKPICQFAQIDSLLFQGSPEPLNEDVVEISPAPVYCRQVIG